MLVHVLGMHVSLSQRKKDLFCLMFFSYELMCFNNVKFIVFVVRWNIVDMKIFECFVKYVVMLMVYSDFRLAVNFCMLYLRSITECTCF